MIGAIICWLRRSHDYGRAQWKIMDATTGAPISDAKIKVCKRCAHVVPVKARARRT